MIRSRGEALTEINKKFTILQMALSTDLIPLAPIHIFVGDVPAAALAELSDSKYLAVK